MHELTHRSQANTTEHIIALTHTLFCMFNVLNTAYNSLQSTDRSNANCSARVSREREYNDRKEKQREIEREREREREQRKVETTADAVLSLWQRCQLC